MEQEPFKVLVVDDEPDIVELLTYNLSKEGYQVSTAADGQEAIDQAMKESPDLILMDIMMPKLDGVEACRMIREIPELQNTRIIFLTARGEEYSEVAAFNVGADDYLTKPIKPRALISRIQAMFRRESGKNKVSTDDTLHIGDFVIDKNSYTLQKGEEMITLPKKEFELIHFLAMNPNRVFSREDILAKIWGREVYVLARTVDVHIRRIREKIGEGYIRTVKGVGYKFEIS